MDKKQQSFVFRMSAPLLQYIVCIWKSFSKIGLRTCYDIKGSTLSTTLITTVLDVSLLPSRPSLLFNSLYHILSNILISLTSSDNLRSFTKTFVTELSSCSECLKKKSCRTPKQTYTVFCCKTLKEHELVRFCCCDEANIKTNLVRKGFACDHSSQSIVNVSHGRE